MRFTQLGVGILLALAGPALAQPNTIQVQPSRKNVAVPAAAAAISIGEADVAAAELESMRHTKQLLAEAANRLAARAAKDSSEVGSVEYAETFSRWTADLSRARKLVWWKRVPDVAFSEPPRPTPEALSALAARENAHRLKEEQQRAQKRRQEEEHQQLLQQQQSATPQTSPTESSRQPLQVESGEEEAWRIQFRNQQILDAVKRRGPR